MNALPYMRFPAHLFTILLPLAFSSACSNKPPVDRPSPNYRDSRLAEFAKHSCEEFAPVELPMAEGRITPKGPDVSQACLDYYTGLRRLYDSLRSCRDSSECLLVYGGGHVPDLGIAALSGPKASKKLEEYMKKKETLCPDKVRVVVETLPVFSATCVEGLCQPCIDRCCEKGVIYSEKPWLEQNRRAEAKQLADAPEKKDSGCACQGKVGPGQIVPEERGSVEDDTRN
jgi:hypothetical protein